MSAELNTLSAMPGDFIDWITRSEFDKQCAEVESCGFQPLPDGKGKLWTYRTTDGAIVPHDKVTKIERRKQKTTADYLSKQEFVKSSEPNPSFEEKELRADITRAVQMLDISNHMKVAIVCLLADDPINLTLAETLITHRLREINELEKAAIQKAILDSAPKP